MSEKVFVFDTSRGAGIPGLPHEVTEEQARRLGVSDVLKAAIANGSYKEKPQAKPKPAAKVEKE